MVKKQQVGVDCQFGDDGSVEVRQVLWNGRWQTVGQGRQWVDGNGRHVLIMLPGEQVRELILQPDTLCWHLLDPRQRQKIQAV